MVHESFLQEGATDHTGSSNFDAAARTHLKALEEAGETPEQIVSQLSDVAVSYANRGLQEEARALHEIIRHYQMRWTKDVARPS